MLVKVSNSFVLNTDHIIFIDFIEDTCLHLRVATINGKEIDLIKETAENFLKLVAIDELVSDGSYEVRREDDKTT